MIMGPKFLVADEPVSMLDASVRVEILKLLRGLQETHNLSVIYYTRSFNRSAISPSAIFVMYAGNLVEKANVRQVLDHSASSLHHGFCLPALLKPDARNAETFKELPTRRAAEFGKSAYRMSFSIRVVPKAIQGLCVGQGTSGFRA